MKKHLFYTFLSIYILTALVTILGLVGTLNIADKYLSQLVPTVILETVVAVIALFKGAKFFDETQNYIKETSLIKKNQGITKVEQKVVNKENSDDANAEENKLLVTNENDIIELSKNVSPSLEDFLKVYSKLEGRFKERANYVKNIHGKNVSWNCLVKNIKSEYDGSITVFLSPIDPKLYCSIITTFHKSMEAEIYSLRKNDHVTVKGVVNLDIPNMPSINGTDIKLLKL